MTLAGHILPHSALPARRTGTLGEATPVVITAAALFVVAGAAKFWTPSPTATLNVLPRAAGIAEVLFGGWLLSGIGRRVALFASAAIFAVFTAFHGWHLYRGDRALCDCFGAAHLPHGLLACLCLSGSAACLLAGLQRTRPQRVRGLKILTSVCFGALTVWVLGAAAMRAPTPPPSRGWAHAAIDRLPNAQRAVLSHGSWRVVFIDPDCDSCQALLAETEHAYLSGRIAEELLVVVQRPVEGRAPLFSAIDADILVVPDFAPPCLPAVLVLADGVVQHTSCGGSAGLPPRSGPL